MLLRCTLILPDGADLTGRTVQIRVEDVSIMDGAAPLIATTVVDAAELPRRGPRLGPVTVDAPSPPPASHWSVRAQVSAGPTLRAGDLLSTTNVPVSGPGDYLIPVVEVA